MPRYYNFGKEAIDADAQAALTAVDDEDKAAKKAAILKHHPFTSPQREQLVAVNGRVYIRKPGMYCMMHGETGSPIPELVPWEPGSVAFGLLGYGFFVVPPGGDVVLDPSVPEKAVKDVAPHLLTEAEALARGFLKPAVELKQQAKPQPQK